MFQQNNICFIPALHLLLAVAYCTYTKACLNLVAFWALIYAAHSPTLYIFFCLRLLVLNSKFKEIEEECRTGSLCLTDFLCTQRKLVPLSHIHNNIAIQAFPLFFHLLTHSHISFCKYGSFWEAGSGLASDWKARSSSGRRRRGSSGSPPQSKAGSGSVPIKVKILELWRLKM